MGAGCEFAGGFLFEEVENFGVLNLVSGRPERGAFAFFCRGHQVFVVGKAGRVIEKIADGDGFTVGGKIGEDIGEGVVVAELAVADEQHDGHGGELLGAGGEAEIGFRVDFGEGAEFASAIAALECGAAIFADEDGEARGVGAGKRGEEGIEGGGHLVLRGLRGGWNDNEDKEQRKRT